MQVRRPLYAVLPNTSIGEVSSRRVLQDGPHAWKSATSYLLPRLGDLQTARGIMSCDRSHIDSCGMAMFVYEGPATAPGILFSDMFQVLLTGMDYHAKALAHDWNAPPAGGQAGAVVQDGFGALEPHRKDTRSRCHRFTFLHGVFWHQEADQQPPWGCVNQHLQLQVQS